MSSKAADMAKTSAKGGFHLLWGLVISTVISSIGTIFISRLLGPDQYGLYVIVLTVPNLIVVFRDWGINSAMIRCTAQYRAENRTDEIRSIFTAGLIFEATLGFIISIIAFSLSEFLAITLFNRPAIAPLIQLASFIALAHALMTTATAAFTGMEKMEHNSIMLIGQSIFKTALIIALVAIGLGTPGAITGYVAATFVAGIIGLLLTLTIYRRLPKPYANKLQLKAYTTSMLQYGIPLSLSAIISGFQTQFYAFLLPIYYATDNAMIGNYGVASNFVVLITFFATPITTMLFPAFSKLDAKKDQKTLKNVFQFSIKYASILVVPVAALVMSLSEPAVSTLFGSTYNTAPLFLALLSITYMYTAFGNLSTGNLINSQGDTTFNLYLTIITAAIGFPTSYVLIMNFGVLGLIGTALTVGLPSMFISLYWVRKRYGVTVDWKSTAKILLSSAITAALTYIIVAQLSFSSWIRLIIGVAAFLLIIIPVAIVTRTVTRSDVDNIRGMASALGPVGNIVNALLRILEKTMTILKA